MLDLQPLINRLVDDLLVLIRTASVEELRDVLAGRDGHAGDAEHDRPPPAPRRQSRSTAIDVAPKRTRRAKPRVIAVPRVAAPSIPPSEAQVAAEITNPALLLSSVENVEASPEEAPGIETPAVAPEAPAVALAPSAPSIVLRRGETLARASDRGVVIRRRKA